MHERRNFVLIILFVAAVGWALVAWVFTAVGVIGDLGGSTWLHRWLSLGAMGILGCALIYTLFVEDKLPDELSRVLMGRPYFEQDGLCFAIMTRVVGHEDSQRAEICFYYQNRFSGPCEAVIHLRPPEGTIHSHRGARDIHVAFICEGGGFGVIHQPVAVEHAAQGQPVSVEVAAAVRWPRGHGDQLRSHRGERCGTFDVDWALAYRQSKHELCGEIELRSPARLQLTLPDSVATTIQRSEFHQEVVAAAPEP